MLPTTATMATRSDPDPVEDQNKTNVLPMLQTQRRWQPNCPKPSKDQKTTRTYAVTHGRTTNPNQDELIYQMSPLRK